jgi:hypothetical protein
MKKVSVHFQEDKVSYRVIHSEEFKVGKKTSANIGVLDSDMVCEAGDFIYLRCPRVESRISEAQEKVWKGKEISEV